MEEYKCAKHEEGQSACSPPLAMQQEGKKREKRKYILVIY